MADPTEPSTRLCLVIPRDMDPNVLMAVLEPDDIACALFLTAGQDDAGLRGTIARLRPLAQDRGVAFLVQDNAALAAETGSDGVHVSDPADYGAARQRLGEDAIVGVGCGGSRHEAMVAAERGADYVAFGAPGPEPSQAEPELLIWWQLMMTIPCVAFGANGPEDCARFAASGADFVAVGSAVWADPEGAVAGLRACRQAIAEATKETDSG